MIVLSEVQTRRYNSVLILKVQCFNLIKEQLEERSTFIYFGQFFDLFSECVPQDPSQNVGNSFHYTRELVQIFFNHSTCSYSLTLSNSDAWAIARCISLDWKAYS